MTDFIAKARAGRVIALEYHRSGAVMFFPEELEDTVVTSRRRVTHVGKPMFVRSSAMDMGTSYVAPRPEQAANAPLQLREDQLVENVMRRAA